MRQIKDFMDSNGFSFVRIPHEDFKVYEQGLRPFRSWFDDYCKTHGLNSRADICVVGPSIKDISSADRKTATGEHSPERVLDYLRCMPIVLKKHPNNSKHRYSMDTLARVIDAFEGDDRAIARKNTFWKPNPKTGIRTHKTLWSCSVDEGQDLHGFETVAEIKVEHEAHMDIDRLTRAFLQHGRDTTSLMVQFAENVTDWFSRILSSASRKTADKDRMINNWGRLLYNYFNHEQGFNRFLDPKILSDPEMREKFKDVVQPLTLKQIIYQIECDLAKMPYGQALYFERQFQKSGLFPPDSGLGINQYHAPSSG